MEDLLKDFKKNWFLDETNTGTTKGIILLMVKLVKVK